MSGRDYNLGRDTLDFIDRLSGLTDPALVVAALRDKLVTYGFHAFLITGLPEFGDRIDPLVLLNGWPPGWFDLYRERSYCDWDPIVAHCRQTVDPFAWRDIYHEESASPRQREVMRRARDFDMIEGFCVPIHGEEGFTAVVTMAGRRPDLSRQARSGMHLMSIYAHSKACACLRPVALRRLLTVREREVLTWMAVGKTTEGVAERLGVSAGTAEAHFENAARKLGVRGRTRTIIEAYRRGEIAI
jgi:LuxR family quorum sensing-dependent transcriptional regulator